MLPKRWSPNYNNPKAMKYLTVWIYIFYSTLSYSQEVETTHYPDGNKHMKVQKSTKDLIYHQIWDIEGNELLKGGNGIHYYFDSNRNVTSHLVIKDSIAIQRFDVRYNKNDTLFWIAENWPVYPKGKKGFYNDITYNLKKYGTPNKIKKNKNGVEKVTVFLHFVVDKEGNITEVSVLKPINEYLDEIALLAIKNLKRWEPGLVDGKNANYQFIIPIDF